MPLTLSPTVRYDMPASFGPSMVPDRTVIAHAECLVLTSATSRDAAAAILPEHFTAPEKPALTISHVKYRDVDYLGGRSYNELVVGLGASFESGAEGVIDAALGVVLWVDQPGALIAGREFMGLPKLLGFVSDLEGDEGGCRFTVGEYEAVLVRGAVQELIALDDARLSKLNERAGRVQTFGWKYVAAPGGGSDLDYPLVNVMRWSYERAWTGKAQVEFISPSFADAPLSKAAVDSLARLPIKGPWRAFRGVGQATIDRTATRRLA